MRDAEDLVVSGWNTCPSCQFLVAPDAPRCNYCGADLARAPIPAASPLFSGTASTLPPPPPPPLQPAPGAPYPPAPPGGAGRNTRAIVTAIAVSVVLALGLVGLVTVLDVGSDPYPDAWDPRIEPLAKFVAEERGLLFEHPVYVDFLDKAAFDADVTAGGGPTEEERAELDRYAGLLRAFGLMTGDVDLFESNNELMADGVAAYYSPETKRITVNGDVLDTATKVTVVHELTHALQDQHFDLLGLDSQVDDVTAETLRAVVEGDATRIETRYYEQLTDAEKEDAAASYEAGVEEADYGRFPRVLVASFGAPYAFGGPFVGALSGVDGDAAVNDALSTPPSSMEQVMDPFAYFDGDEPIEVTEPELADGDESFYSGTLGAFFLYLMLNERMDAKEALAVADGWGGDTYVAFTRDGTSCVRVDIAGDSAEALTRLRAALDTWAAGMPPASATISGHDLVSIESCDPGIDAEIPPPVTPDLDPLTVPSTRAAIAGDVLAGGWSVDEARCIVERFFAGLTVEHMTAADDRYGAEIEELRSATLAACS
jgi:hypothetical protein